MHKNKGIQHKINIHFKHIEMKIDATHCTRVALLRFIALKNFKVTKRLTR